jgi:MFS superfamily sulfate permease-like transporter
MNVQDLGTWTSDWLWGLPIIVLTVMIHVVGLGLIKRQTDKLTGVMWNNQALFIGAATLCITILHGLEASIWAIAFLLLKAVPEQHTAMLYSLNALTAFGHIDIKLLRQWQLMGAMESLNGWILFGLSTAYLFALVQRFWSHPRSLDG